MNKKIKESNRNKLDNSVLKKIFGIKFFNQFPEVTKVILDLANITENFNTETPQTEWYKFNKSMEELNNLSETKRKKLGRLLFWVSKKILKDTFDKKLITELRKHTKDKAKLDSRYSLLLKLIHKADENVTNSPMLILQYYLDPRVTMVANLKAGSSLEAAKKAKGEIRANLVKNALIEVAEYTYKPYLHAIRGLSYLAEGKMPPHEPLNLGELVKQNANRLADYPGLLEERAGWLRNCAAHRLPGYLPEEDSMIVGAKGVPTQKIKVQELLEIVEKMYLISTHTISQVSYLYTLRNILNEELMEKIWNNSQLALSGDLKKMNVAENNIDSFMESKFQDLIKFLNQNTQKGN